MRGKGEGTVFQRADGRWVAQVDAGVDRTTGRRRRPKRVRASKKAAVAALADLRREVGTPAALDRVTVAAWCTTWLVDCADRVRAGTMSPRTAAGYESDVRNHVIPAVGEVRLDQLAPGHVQRMMTGMQADGLGPRTAGAARGTLSAALSAAVADGLIQVNVARAARPPKRPRRPASAFTHDEFTRIVTACEDHRLGDMFVFDLETGLRTSELLGLAWQHVDLDDGTYEVVEGLHRVGRTAADALGLEAGVHASHPKTEGSGVRTPMSPVAVAALRSWRTIQVREQLAAGPAWSDSGRVFTTPRGTALDDGNVRREFRALLESAGVPTHTRDGRGRQLHELRRTFATRLRERGVSVEYVQRLGRWSSPQMLLELYRAIDDTDLRRVVGQDESGSR